MSSSAFIKRFLINTTIVAALLLLLGKCFGFYYGWVDDVLFEQAIRGVFTAQPIPDFFVVFRLYWQLLVILYQKIPGHSWYGIILLAFQAINCIVIFCFADGLLNRYAFFEKLLAKLLFGSAFLLNPLIEITFTEVALIAVAGGVLLLFVSDNRAAKTIAWLAILNGLLIRFDAALAVPAVLAMCLPMYYNRPGKIKTISALVIFFALCFVTDKVVEPFISIPQRNQDVEIDNVVKNLSLLNGGNINAANLSSFSKLEQLKINEISLYFITFETLPQQPTLNKITNNCLFCRGRLNALSWKLKINYFRLFHSYPLQYKYLHNPGFHICLFFLQFIILLLFSGKGPTRRAMLYAGFLFVMLFALTALLYKMEDRIFYPCWLLFYSLSLWAVQNKNGNTSFFKPIVYSLFIPALFGLAAEFNFYNSLKTEMREKADVINELNTEYRSKYFYVDLPAMTCINQELLYEVNLSPDVKPLAYGDFWYSLFNSHREYLKNLTGGEDL
ncbi:MAG TPA: hypothetical protein VG603_01235, partial [Chitinophagales bacterium]|nr:hypothetical protein [Chitinophagales bacterium]